MKRHLRWIILILVLTAIAAFFLFDLGDHLSLTALKAQLERLRAYVGAEPVTAAAVYFALYIAITGLSLPGAALLTLLGGALFGLVTGTILVSFASTIGATLAFLVSRLVLSGLVRARFKRAFEAIDRGIEREGGLYLFSLRLSPLFPFFVINLVMGLTRIGVWRYALISQLGMLPGTLAYVNAGRELGRLETTADILSPGLILSFVIIGLLPLASRRVIDALRRRRVYRAYRRPRRCDYNLVVIGGGSAGLVTAFIAAAVKARVVLVEKHRMGGDCLYTGCVPSKTLLRSARAVHDLKRAADFGLTATPGEPDFAAVMARVQRVIAAIEPHDSPERYRGLGVECIQGDARIESPFEVRVGERTLTTRNIVIATGGTPRIPPIPGIEAIDCLTSETLWDLTELPRRLTILGGGPIGCELAQGFARLGAKVTLVEMLERVLAVEDPDASAAIQAALGRDGVRVLTATRAERVEGTGTGGTLHLSGPDGAVNVVFDRLLVAVGRRPNTEGLGIEALGLATGPGGALEVDAYLQTKYPNIYACGDVIAPYQFTHSAAHEAWYCAVNALFGAWRRFRVDYSVLPWVTFTDPEVARVGLNEQQAAERGTAVRVLRYELSESDRALAEEEAHGFVKVLTPRDGDAILGATVVGAHAGEVLAELTLAMRHGIGLKGILGTIHPYPTLAEANRFVAGRWRQATQPVRLMPWLERYHRWVRS